MIKLVTCSLAAILGVGCVTVGDDADATAEEADEELTIGYSYNLLGDAGFESGSGIVPYNWRLMVSKCDGSAVTSSDFITRTQYAALYDSYGLRIRSPFGICATAFAYQLVEVTAGRQYNYGFFARHKWGDAQRFSIQFYYQNTASPLEGPVEEWSSAADTEWNGLSGVVTAPARATLARISIGDMPSHNKYESIYDWDSITFAPAN